VKEKKAIFFDLDETIYPEIDFKKSGFRAVASWLQENNILEFDEALSSLLDFLSEKGSLYPYFFQDICRKYRIDRNIVEDMLHVFRNHQPKITPYSDFVDLVVRCQGRFFMGVITDGLGYVQRNKVAALGLTQWIPESAIIFTDCLSPSTNKYDLKVFLHASAIAGLDGNQCLYVGDNPGKDFNGPKQLGWHTIRICRGIYSGHRGVDMKVMEIDGYHELFEYLEKFLTD
jgi:putative hydrolase of the HAD superfamily